MSTNGFAEVAARDVKTYGKGEAAFHALAGVVASLIPSRRSTRLDFLDAIQAT